MDNIIFLDIDGVLKHPTKSVWYPDAISCLNAYCSHNNINIVISSTWRFLKDLEFFNQILNNKVIGITDDLSKLYKEYTRQYECLNFVSKNKIKNYIMLDDKISEYKDIPYFIAVNPNVGIDLSTVFKINSIFKGNLDYLITENINITDKF